MLLVSIMIKSGFMFMFFDQYDRIIIQNVTLSRYKWCTDWKYENQLDT